MLNGVLNVSIVVESCVVIASSSKNRVSCHDIKLYIVHDDVNDHSRSCEYWNRIPRIVSSVPMLAISSALGLI